jgi:hypothetical protein
MKFRPFALLACLVTVVGVTACQEDPTEEGTGVPEAILTNRTEIHTTVGNKSFFTAFTVDRNLKRIPGILSATSAGGAVVIDSVRYLNELAETRIFYNPTAASTAGTSVTVTGHGLSTDVKVVI